MNNKIGLWTATIVGMNAMIGSGIFFIPASLGYSVGPAGIVTMIFVALASYFMALSISRLAALFPEEGSFYVYAKQWGGHNLGVLANGAYLTGLMIAMGLLTQFAGIFLHHYFSNIPPYVLGLCTLIALIFLNIIGVVLSKMGQYIIVCCTLFPLLSTIILCATKINLNYLHPFAPHGWTSAFKATKDAMFSFFGFEAVASLFAIVEKPEKNVPKAIKYSLSIVALIYILFVTFILLSVPAEIFTDPKMQFTDLLMQILPDNKWIIEGIHFSILSATLGVINAMMWSSANLFLSFAKKFKNSFAKSLIKNNILNSKTSVLFIGLCIFTTFSTLKEVSLFFSLTALFIVFAYITSMITLLTLKSEWKSGQNVKTILGLATATFIFLTAFQDILSKIF